MDNLTNKTNTSDTLFIRHSLSNRLDAAVSPRTFAEQWGSDLLAIRHRGVNQWSDSDLFELIALVGRFRRMQSVMSIPFCEELQWAKQELENLSKNDFIRAFKTFSPDVWMSSLNSIYDDWNMDELSDDVACDKLRELVLRADDMSLVVALGLERKYFKYEHEETLLCEKLDLALSENAYWINFHVSPWLQNIAAGFRNELGIIDFDFVDLPLAITTEKYVDLLDALEDRERSWIEPLVNPFKLLLNQQSSMVEKPAPCTPDVYYWDRTVPFLPSSSLYAMALDDGSNRPGPDLLGVFETSISIPYKAGFVHVTRKLNDKWILSFRITDANEEMIHVKRVIIKDIPGRQDERVPKIWLFELDRFSSKEKETILYSPVVVVLADGTSLVIENHLRNRE